MSIDTRKLAVAAVVGGAYAALTVALAPIAYGPLQFRISEALCILPFFLPYTSWGLFIGCAVANLFGYGILDIVFGSLATLFSSFCIAAIGKKGAPLWRCALACTMPVLWNGVVVGAVIACSSSGRLFPEFPVFALQIALGEAGVMFAVGLPLMRLLPRIKYLKQFGFRL